MKASPTLQRYPQLAGSSATASSIFDLNGSKLIDMHGTSLEGCAYTHACLTSASKTLSTSMITAKNRPTKLLATVLSLR
jgi:hypothetical protein